MNIKIDDQNDAEIVNSTKKQWQTPWSSPEKLIFLVHEGHCFLDQHVQKWSAWLYLHGCEVDSNWDIKSIDRIRSDKYYTDDFDTL